MSYKEKHKVPDSVKHVLKTEDDLIGIFRMCEPMSNEQIKELEHVADCTKLYKLYLYFHHLLLQQLSKDLPIGEAGRLPEMFDAFPGRNESERSLFFCRVKVQSVLMDKRQARVLADKKHQLREGSQALRVV